MWKYTELSYYLASLYFKEDKIIDIIRKSGNSPEFFDSSTKATVYWGNIISYLETEENVKRLVETILKDNRQDDLYLQAFLKDENTKFKTPYSNLKLDNPVKPTSEQLEKVTSGSPTFLPISFLAKGLEKAKSVVKIITPMGSGTGFIIANNYILTNNHVIGNIEVARHEFTRVLCNYEEEKEEELFKLAPDSSNGFATRKVNDWTAIKIDTSGTNIQGRLGLYGHITLGRNEAKRDDFVNIIQHPLGNRKQIALYHNLVLGANASRVHYLTDTQPGSSGSPVFNSKWEVVALHHAGGEMRVVDSDKTELVNEGISINLVLDELKEEKISLK